MSIVNKNVILGGGKKINIKIIPVFLYQDFVNMFA